MRSKIRACFAGDLEEHAVVVPIFLKKPFTSMKIRRMAGAVRF